MATSNHPRVVQQDDAVKRPLRKDAVRNRQLLLDAARTVFAQRGLDARLDDVAEAAGVGVGTAYRHFANKYELAVLVLAREIDAMIELAERAAEMDDPWEAVTLFVTTAVEAQVGDRGLREVITGVHDEIRFVEVNARFNVALGTLVRRGREAGVLRSDVEPSDLGVASTMLCAVADLAGDHRPDLWRRYLPTVLLGLTDAVTPREPALSPTEFRDALDQQKRRSAAH